MNNKMISMALVATVCIILIGSALGPIATDAVDGKTFDNNSASAPYTQMQIGDKYSWDGSKFYYNDVEVERNPYTENSLKCEYLLIAANTLIYVDVSSGYAIVSDLLSWDAIWNEDGTISITFVKSSGTYTKTSRASTWAFCATDSGTYSEVSYTDLRTWIYVNDASQIYASGPGTGAQFYTAHGEIASVVTASGTNEAQVDLIHVNIDGGVLGFSPKLNQGYTLSYEGVPIDIRVVLVPLEVHADPIEGLSLVGVLPVLLIVAILATVAYTSTRRDE